MSAEIAVYEDPTSHKSYAQALKESATPRLQPDWSKVLTGKAVMASDAAQGEDWTDVSSVTSCGWPATESVIIEKGEEVEEQEEGKLKKTQKDGVPVDNTTVREPSQTIPPIAADLPNSVKDVPWVDQDSDTRLPHALHEDITHANRSRRMYNTMQPGYTLGLQPLFGDGSAPEIKKPWRKWPGKSSTFPRPYKGDRYTQEQQETRDKRIQRAEWKKADGEMF
ncbi:hypothetical protein BU17DRAFT_68860 [Hysterangium stoloniferum]|nr:hypothetical protein BU17DRAFT_68860 [Hysterangium stoloniferum]